ncbi:unnamed protein product [Cyclocybe aegerita]|uniref:NAD(P)-binding protein n=1 Tax=Cyclocybe aegerita TaxID=1973307 RepID=A0A8S0VUY9_CYCAE|nr:unnamed protein product [Cyclocybe aegerita]
MGLTYSLFNQGFPPKTKFNVDDIPDLSGKVVIVTGSNTGIGKETAKVDHLFSPQAHRQLAYLHVALLIHNAKVYLAGRSRDKTIAAIDDLKAQTGKEGIYLELDLEDVTSVKASAEDFLSKEKELHILFNNALSLPSNGVMRCPVDMITTQGYDLQFGTNVLGHFYFTKLLPALLAAAKSSPDGHVHVVSTSSYAAYIAKKVDFNTLKDSAARRKTSSLDLYAQSKLRHLAAFEKRLMNLVLYLVHLGALTQLYAGTSPEASQLNGKFLIPWARVGNLPALAADTKLAEELWKWLEEQVADV